MREYMHVRVN